MQSPCFPFSHGLDYSAVQEIQSQCQVTGAWEPLIYRLQAAFGDVNTLSASFLRPASPHGHDADVLKPNHGTSTLDKYTIQMTFELIQECPTMVFEAVLDASRRLLGLLKDIPLTILKELPLTNPNLNAVAILFQIPLPPNEVGTDFMAELLELVSKLNPYMQDSLCQRLVEPVTNKFSMVTDTDDRRSEFKHLLDRTQQLVCERIDLRVSVSGTSPNTDSLVINAAKFLAVLYRLNEREHYVDYTEFYNDAVNEHLEIKEDFPNFKDHKGFSFCTYPFILNPSVKADILKVESVYLMRHELQDAFFRALFEGVNSPYLVLEIHRDRIILDTLQQLEGKSVHDLKKQLRVQFIGEEAVDEGGVQKEFFQLLVRELFDANYGMFTANEESRLCWFRFSPDSTLDDLTFREYKLVGILLGLAVYNGVTLDLHFPLALYKKLMNIQVDLFDLTQLDPGLGRGLEQLLRHDEHMASESDRAFQVDLEYCGQVYTYDLKPRGSDIPLTDENKKEFVDLYTRFILSDSVEKQFHAFKKGFDLVCSDSAIMICRPEEIEQLICGSSDLDFEALENSTLYDGDLDKDSPVIKYFWEIVHSFSYEEKKKLLFFATGSDRAPIGGLSKLHFVIAKNGVDSNRLPTSHTCYNVLMLCDYSSKEQLRERLLMSISNAEGFGMI